MSSERWIQMMVQNARAGCKTLCVVRSTVRHRAVFLDVCYLLNKQGVSFTCRDNDSRVVLENGGMILVKSKANLKSALQVGEFCELAFENSADIPHEDYRLATSRRTFPCPRVQR